MQEHRTIKQWRLNRFLNDTGAAFEQDSMNEYQLSMAEMLYESKREINETEQNVNKHCLNLDVNNRNEKLSQNSYEYRQVAPYLDN